MPETNDVRIPLTGGQSLPAALAVPTGPARPRPAILVLHEMTGLNSDIRQISSRFADAGYVALAPDFLAGLGPRPFCMARFFRGLGRVGTGRPYRQLEAARAWLGRRAEVDERRIGVAGFCIGGGFALLYAAAAGSEAVRAVAPFYAGVPEDAGRALAGICPVVAAYGGRDRVFGPHADRLEAALDTLGVEHEVTVYPDAGHSFMNRHTGLIAAIEPRLPMHGGHHEPSAAVAWTRMLAFLDRHLGPETGVAT